MVYFIFTGDLIASRKIPNRSQIQKQLQLAIENINNQFNEQILCPFVIGWGDAFQGVLISLSGLYNIIEAFENQLTVNFRCGIGIGDISTEFTSNPLEMDGPAFQASQYALEEAKKNQRFVCIKSERIQFDMIVNTLWVLFSSIKSGWTQRQYEVIQLRRLNLTYEEIGQKLGITKQAVYNILKSAQWEAIEHGLNHLEY
jgi:hypothetical protein